MRQLWVSLFLLAAVMAALVGLGRSVETLTEEVARDLPLAMEAADRGDWTEAEKLIKEAGKYPMWPFKENSELADSYMVAAQQMDIEVEPEWTFAENECALFYNKRPDLDMICIGANIQEGQELAESLVLYLQSLGGDN